MGFMKMIGLGKLEKVEKSRPAAELLAEHEAKAIKREAVKKKKAKQSLVNNSTNSGKGLT